MKSTSFFWQRSWDAVRSRQIQIDDVAALDKALTDAQVQSPADRTLSPQAGVPERAARAYRKWSGICNDCVRIFVVGTPP